MRRRSNEPLWWAPFGAGMMVDALVIPALVIVTGLLIPLGMVTGGIQHLLQHPLTRLVLSGVISLSFFHAAHRLRFTLADLGLKGLGPLLGIVCYGGAIVGTLIAGAVALGLI
jgi:fumarate reductase subunit D